MKPIHHVLIAVSGALLMVLICTGAYLIATHPHASDAKTFTQLPVTPERAAAIGTSAPPATSQPAHPQWSLRLGGNETRLAELIAAPQRFAGQTMYLFGCVRIDSARIYAQSGRTEYTFYEYDERGNATGRQATILTSTVDRDTLQQIALADEKENSATGVRILAMLNYEGLRDGKIFEALDWQTYDEEGWEPWQNRQRSALYRSDIDHLAVSKPGPWVDRGQ